MRLSLIILTILAFAAVQNTDAFVNKGSAPMNKRPVLSTSSTTGLCAKKKAAKSTVETLRKPELIAQVAEKLDTSKVGAEAAVAAVLETIVDNVVDGKKVSLPGFGNFERRFRNARKGRNPQTGEELDIAASYSPGFTAAKAFKDKANS